jgi:alkylated DNA repair dioxygenase AlkB
VAPEYQLQPTGLPAGFLYRSEFLNEKEEATLIEHLQRLKFQPFNFQGYVAKRRIVEYGIQYDFSNRKASGTEAIPDVLTDVRDKSAEWAGLRAEEILEAVVTEYPRGAPIGWHRDVPQFDTIIGVSLASECRMRFKPYKQPGRIISITLQPRSVYLMRGVARWGYQHSIPAVKELRYSINFRTLNKGRKKSPARKFGDSSVMDQF